MPPTADIKQSDWRLRNDDGSESAATWMGAANEARGVAIAGFVRVRWLLKNIGLAAKNDAQYKFHYRLNGGAWANIQHSTTPLSYDAASTHYALADDTTQQLGSGTFDGSNDGMVEASERQSAQWVFDASAEAELEAIFAIKNVGGVANGDEIEIRVSDVSSGAGVPLEAGASYAKILVGGQHVVANAIASSATVFAPAVSLPVPNVQNVAPNVIASAAQVFAPAVNFLQVAGNLVGPSSTVFAPGVAGGSTPFRVDVNESFGALESVAPSEIDGGRNWAVVDTEILGFEDAALVSSGVYDLDSLHRGGRDTPKDGHAAPELFVLVEETIARIALGASSIGLTVQVKCVSPGQVLGDVTAESVVIAAPTAPAWAAAMAAMERFAFVAPEVILARRNTAMAWSSLNLSGVVPVGAVAVRLSADWRMQGEGGDSEARVNARSAAGSSVYPVASGMAENGSDSGGLTIVDIPVSGQSVDIEIVGGFPGSDQGVEITLLGYWS